MSADDAHLQLLYQPHLAHNAASLSTLKWLCTSFAGSVAGVLGLENYWGFALFFASILLTTAVVWSIQCKGDVDRYVQGGWWEIINPGQENIASFILFWTLFYGLVHVYD
ncbi:hypothetical protein DACRYDRAFT_61496 [Dacryopinax primogenitus]|uniref:ER membrane protein complex subunit 6 n=1 Tax=Dacryopinax primogenitus (strain DJM 731) TaxID=1858805 RepID=M5GCA8_DACPD|nr:uncharacterized protein DACRYDRAFT_61496 [Dacryopinax primogenitus]EJU06669.1 hypothetical protein DACRYDRAFT_61496 [Dacryopinax primogenitus]